MKKSYVRIFIFQMIFILLLFLNSFVWNILNNYGMIIFALIMLILFKCFFGFEKDIDDLIAVVPFSNCIELQFSKETLKLFVPDGNIPLRVLNMLK